MGVQWPESRTPIPVKPILDAVGGKSYRQANQTPGALSGRHDKVTWYTKGAIGVLVKKIVRVSGAVWRLTSLGARVRVAPIDGTLSVDIRAKAPGVPSYTSVLETLLTIATGQLEATGGVPKATRLYPIGTLFDIVRGPDVQVATGTYVGDGSASLSITGVGFSPDVVVLFHDAGQVVIKGASSVWGTGSADVTKGWLPTTGIQSLDSDGFRVGNDTNVNKLGETHYFLALKGDGLITTGRYSVPSGGLPADKLILTGLTPVMAWGFNDPGIPSTVAVVKTDTMTDPDSAYLGFAPFQTDEIKTLEATGFTIGGVDNTTMGDHDTTVYWIAFGANSGLVLGQYTGDGNNNRVILSGIFDYALVMGDLTQNKVHKPSSVTDPLSHEITTTGDIVGGRIQSINPFQVGIHPQVNNSGSDYHYFLWDSQGVAGGGDFGSDLTVELNYRTRAVGQ